MSAALETWKVLPHGPLTAVGDEPWKAFGGIHDRPPILRAHALVHVDASSASAAPSLPPSQIARRLSRLVSHGDRVVRDKRNHLPESLR